MFAAAAARLRARATQFAAAAARRAASGSAAGPGSAQRPGDAFLRALDRLLDGVTATARFVHARHDALMSVYGRWVVLSFAGPPLGYAGYYLYTDAYKTELCMEALKRTDPHEPAEADGWIGREAEIAQLTAALRGSPERILLVSGGPDAGKSALLKRVLEGRPYVLKMDLQAKAIQDVDMFVRYFNECINARFLSLRTWALDWLPLQGTSNWRWKNKLSLLDFQRALGCLNAALRRIQEETGGACVPVICIDDEGTLLRLSERADGRVLVDALLKWAVGVTKEHQLAHVVFVPSHRFAARYLSSAGGMEGRVKQVCVGDLTRPEAAAFLRSRLPAASAADVAAAVAATGGRITDLLAFARAVQAGVPPAAALEEAAGQAREALRAALQTRGGPERRWRPAQVAAALRLLAARLPDGAEGGERDGAASEIKVLREAFGHDHAALLAAAADGILALRPGWTPDIGGKPKERNYVCAASPLLLTAFRGMLESPEDAATLAAAEAADDDDAKAPAPAPREAGEEVAAGTAGLAADAALVAATRPHLNDGQLRRWVDRVADRQRALLRAEAARG